MEFKERQAQYEGRKKLIKVDEYNHPIADAEEILVNIIRDEGEEFFTGTPLNAENLNKGNWRDDASLSFASQPNNSTPIAKIDATQIVTKANGETLLVPPVGKGITGSLFSIVDVGGDFASRNGYVQFSNGLLIQWGFVSNTGGLGNYTATISKSYGHTNWCVIPQQYANRTDIMGANDNFFVVSIVDGTTFTYRKDNNCQGLYFIALGHIK